MPDPDGGGLLDLMGVGLVILDNLFLRYDDARPHLPDQEPIHN